MKTLAQTSDALELTIHVHHDLDCESPAAWDGWSLYSFSNRHANFRHPDEYIDEYGRSPDDVVAKPEVQAKLGCGLAHWLSYYEHSGCRWSLMGEGPQCPWDTVRLAGILVWEAEAADLGPKASEARQEDARAFLDAYTDWCNGACYGYIIKADGQEIDSCCGFVGQESLADAVRSAVGEFKMRRDALTDKLSVSVSGEAAYALDGASLT